MSAARGFAGGVAGLSLLELVLSNKSATGRVSGVFGAFTGLLRHWLDPNIALIPDLRTNAPSGLAPPGQKVEANVYTTPRRLPASPQPAKPPPTTLSA
jgi:hypothetical protein